MDQRTTFHCTHCRFHAQVFGGEHSDRLGRTLTIACPRCRNLQDVWLWDSHMPKDAPMREPECRRFPGHHVEPWVAGDPCPRCGSPMTSSSPAGHTLG